MSKAYKEKIQRVEGAKKISIFIMDSSHAEFLLKLKYDGISQKNFFKLLIYLYLKDDLDIKNIIYKSKNISNRKRKNIEEDKKQQEEVSNDFSLNDDEIQNIFDILEKENPEL